MTAIELLQRESDTELQICPAEGQIGSILPGREELHVLSPELQARAEAVMPELDQEFPQDIPPRHTDLLHGGRKHLVLITHKMEQNGEISWTTRSIQDMARNVVTHAVEIPTMSILVPKTGKFVGKILGEVHMRPDDLDKVDPRLVRPLTDRHMRWYEDLAYTIARHKAN